IADETPPAVRGRAFGLHRAADTAGAVVGPLLGLGLYEALHHHLRPLFFVATIPAAGSVALVGLVRERRDSTPAPVDVAADGARRRLPRRYWRVVGFLALFGLVDFPDALLILRAKALGLGFVAIIGASVLYNAVYASVTFPPGSLSDRVPRRRLVAAGLAFLALTSTAL